MSWRAKDDKEFAFFFEDDIEVSSRYFDFTLVALHRYVLPKGMRVSGSETVDKLVGIALNTPRFNEITYPPRDWIPLDELDQSDTQFLFQLPCSWGALYFPWKWREFLYYYNWRSTRESQLLDDAIPHSATKYWRRSWKKFLIELMFMRGEVMLYISLDDQVSLSTHHREPGEHTDANPEDPLVDELTTLVLPYFTVPLITDGVDDDEYYRMMADEKDLEELPIVSYYHERVDQLNDLFYVGINTRSTMNALGWTNENDKKGNRRCILPDNGNADDTIKKYLLYEPQFGIHEQLDALRNAAVYAYITGRSLVLPDFVTPEGIMPLTQIFDVALLKERISINNFEEAKLEGLTNSDLAMNHLLRDDILDKYKRGNFLSLYGLSPNREIRMYHFPTNETEIRNAYEGCYQKILSFSHLYRAFSSFDDSKTDEEFKDWLSRAVRIAEPYQSEIQQIKELVNSDLCVMFSRAECTGAMEQLMAPKDGGQVIFDLSCKIAAAKATEYGLEDAKKVGIEVKGVFVYDETGTEELLKAPAGKLLTLKRSIKKLVMAKENLGKLSGFLLEGFIDQITFDTCVQSSFFLGHPFSHMSREMLLARGLDKPYNIIGSNISAKQSTVKAASL